MQWVLHQLVALSRGAEVLTTRYASDDDNNLDYVHFLDEIEEMDEVEEFIEMDEEASFNVSPVNIHTSLEQ